MGDLKRTSHPSREGDRRGGALLAAQKGNDNTLEKNSADAICAALSEVSSTLAEARWRIGRQCHPHRLGG
jgi:hypothetical protein